MPPESSGSTSPSTVTFAWRGRDIALLLPSDLVCADDETALAALFGAERVDGAHTLLARDRRGAFFRLRPCDFARVKAAIVERNAYPIVVDFAEVPLLPEPLASTIMSRPYQEEALLAWRAAGYRGVVVLPTGAGKTIIGAL
ncbi:MAG TPA: DEAD/DEAH box helicase family protein, partial [Ktedonobacterales bacterium]